MKLTPNFLIQTLASQKKSPGFTDSSVSHHFSWILMNRLFFALIFIMLVFCTSLSPHMSCTLYTSYCGLVLCIFRTFIAKFSTLAYFSRKIANFQVRHVLWRHNYVMDCSHFGMYDREDQYLSIDIEKFIGGSVAKI